MTLRQHGLLATLIAVLSAWLLVAIPLDAFDGCSNPEDVQIDPAEWPIHIREGRLRIVPYWDTLNLPQPKLPTKLRVHAGLPAGVKCVEVIPLVDNYRWGLVVCHPSYQRNVPRNQLPILNLALQGGSEEF